MRVQETIKMQRDCLAIAVPSGQRVLIGKDGEVGLVQALGGSFTVKANGRLFRIDGKDADALGKDPLPLPELPHDATDTDVEHIVWQQMRACYDPEIPINIVDLGLIYRCEVIPLTQGGWRVEVDMTLTAPGCGMGDILASDVRELIIQIPNVEDATVEVVFDPPWDASRMTEEARLATGLF